MVPASAQEAEPRNEVCRTTKNHGLRGRALPPPMELPHADGTYRKTLLAQPGGKERLVVFTLIITPRLQLTLLRSYKKGVLR